MKGARSKESMSDLKPVPGIEVMRDIGPPEEPAQQQPAQDAPQAPQFPKAPEPEQAPPPAKPAPEPEQQPPPEPEPEPEPKALSSDEIIDRFKGRVPRGRPAAPATDPALERIAQSQTQLGEMLARMNETLAEQRGKMQQANRDYDQGDAGAEDQIVGLQRGIAESNRQIGELNRQIAELKQGENARREQVKLQNQDKFAQEVVAEICANSSLSRIGRRNMGHELLGELNKRIAAGEDEGYPSWEEFVVTTAAQIAPRLEQSVRDLEALDRPEPKPKRDPAPRTADAGRPAEPDRGNASPPASPPIVPPATSGPPPGAQTNRRQANVLEEEGFDAKLESIEQQMIADAERRGARIVQ